MIDSTAGETVSSLIPGRTKQKKTRLTELVHAVSTHLDRMYLPAVMLRPVHLSEGPTAYLFHQLVLLFTHHHSEQHRTSKQTRRGLFLITRGFLHQRSGFLSMNWMRGNKAKIPLSCSCPLAAGYEDTVGQKRRAEGYAHMFSQTRSVYSVLAALLQLGKVLAASNPGLVCVNAGFICSTNRKHPCHQRVYRSSLLDRCHGTDDAHSNNSRSQL